MSNTKFVSVKNNFTSEKLSFKENAVLSYLCSLSQKKYCYASNQHLCDTLGIEDRTMYRILSRLEDKNLIIRETKSTGKYGKDRKIYVHPTVKKTYHT
jgi:DNA-binding MarR family transcriptional regulator